MIVAHGYTVVLWWRASTSTYRLSRRDTSPQGLRCDPVAGTTLGGRSTAGVLMGADDVRCYEFTATAGTRYLMGVRSPANSANFSWLDQDGTLQCLLATYCMTPQAGADRTYRLLVWGGLREGLPFQLGRTVGASVGTWSPRATSYRYEWRLNGKAIKGATKATLKLTAAMAGKTLTVVVTARRTGYQDGRATSSGAKIKK